MTAFGDGRAVAVVNPAAGVGRTLKQVEELAAIFKRAGARIDIVRTSAPADATRLTRDAVLEGYPRVIAVGGDGTVHEVVNGLVGSRVELAVVPLGSANDFAHALGIRDWRSAAMLAARGRVRPVDLAIANGRAFANCVGVGVDAAGARVVGRHKRVVGSLGYLTAAAGTLATYRPSPVRLHVNGEVISGKHLLVVAANGEHFANGMRIAPGASVDDGMLDLCIVGDTSLLESIALLVRAYRGTHVGQPKVRMVRVREIVIEQEGPLPVQVDGEVMNAQRVEVRCMPRALSVVTT